MNKQRSDRDFAHQLLVAVGKGDLKTVRRIIKGGIDVDTEFWYEGTILHEAVSANEIDIVRYLLSANANINAPNKDGRTPLHIACRAALRLPALPLYICYVVQDGRTPLHIACRAALPQIVTLLLQNGAEVSSKTEDGRTCLHIAAWRGREDIVDLLLEKGASVNDVDEDEWTPLYWTCRLNFFNIAKILIDHGASINTCITNGRTPLHEALYHGHGRLSAYLITEGADLTAQSEVDGSLLETLVCRSQCELDPHLIRFLVASGYRFQDDDWLDHPQPRLAGNKELSDWLLDQKHKPMALTDVCRLKIRQCLSSYTNGSIRLVASSLPLPSLLLDSIMLKRETQCYLGTISLEIDPYWPIMLCPGV